MISTASFLDQVATILEGIESTVNDQALAGNGLPNSGDLQGLPIFGDTLAEESSTFFDNLSRDLKNAVIDSVGDAPIASADKLLEALETVFPGVALREDDGKVIFQVNQNVTQAVTKKLPGDLNLEALGIEFRKPGSTEQLEPQATFDINYRLNFGIGVDFNTALDTDPNNDVFFDVSVADMSSQDDEEIGITINNIKLQDTSAIMGFLSLNVQDAGSEVNLSIDITDGNDDKLLASEIELAKSISPIAGKSDIKVQLTSKVVDDDPSDGSNTERNNSSFLNEIKNPPQAQTELSINWDFSDAAIKPSVSLKELTVNAGSLIADLLYPIITPIREISEPFGTVYEAFEVKIPFLGDIDLIEIAEGATAGRFLVDAGIDTIELLGQFDQFLGSIASAVDSITDTPLLIGDVDLGNFDLRSFTASAEQSDISGRQITLGDLENALPAGTSYDAYRNFFRNVNAFNSLLAEPILDLPILKDPAVIASTFLGQAYDNTFDNERVEFVRFTLPSLDLNIESEKSFSFPGLPIDFGLGGSIDASLQLGFVYDSLGLEKWKEADFDVSEARLLADGLLVDDHREGEIDQPEASISGRLFAQSPEVGIPLIASVGIDGGIEASFFADLEDAGESGNDLGDSDGQIRGSEIINKSQALGFDCLLDLSGEINAFLGGYIRLAFKKRRKNFGKINLTRFEFSDCPKHNPILAKEGPENFAGGELELNVGSLASKRLFVSTIDEAETYFLEGTGSANSDTVTVFGFGSLQIFEDVTTIVGDMGEFDDTLAVSNLLLSIDISGGNGDDYLMGGENSDTLNGNAGNDVLAGEGGDDQLYGEDGNDLIEGGEGNDNIYGGNNSISDIESELPGDELLGDAGNDFIDGGAGADFIDGGDDDDTLVGGDGDDLIIGDSIEFEEDDLVGEFEEIANLDSNSDLPLAATAEAPLGGNDSLNGGQGNDQLYGVDGDDTLVGGSGNDEINGGIGIDTVDYYSDPNNVLVDLETGEATDGFGDKDILSELENIIGSNNGDDVLTGNELSNLISGEAGTDEIEGREGDDILRGGAGSDVLNGGGGVDTILYDTSREGVVANLTTKRGAFGDAQGDTYDSIEVVDGSEYKDRLIGSENSDTLRGRGDDDFLDGRDGDDVLQGNDGQDDLKGGNGNDTLEGGNGGDTLLGDSGNDLIMGGQGNDYLEGDDGEDILSGGSGLDQIEAGLGNDLIEGDSGNDTLAGGGGQDLFLIQRGDDNETIIDFEGMGTGTNPSEEKLSELDVLQFEGKGFTVRNMLLTQQEKDLLISFETVDDATVLLKNFELENLENIGSGSGTTNNNGNILFLPEASEQIENAFREFEGKFDVFDADWQRSNLISRNIVTFLNDLDNDVSGFDDSDDVIHGLGGADTLYGLGGNDLLRGGLGDDLLTGGTGADLFAFHSLNQGIDTIADFSTQESDLIQLSKLGFDSDLTEGILNTDAFSLGLASSTAHRVLYDQSTGLVSYDVDGSGKAQAIDFARVTPSTSLSHRDFVVL